MRVNSCKHSHTHVKEGQADALACNEALLVHKLNQSQNEHMSEWASGRVSSKIVVGWLMSG